MPTLQLRPLNLVFNERVVTDRTRPGAQQALFDTDYATYKAAWNAQEEIMRC
jgi:hypothetical protein